MATKDNKALKWLYDNDIKKDNLKSSVFFVALKNLYKSKADRKKLDKASEYGAIVLRAIDRKKTCKDKQYCLLLYTNTIALQKDIPVRELPTRKKADIARYKNRQKKSHNTVFKIILCYFVCFLSRHLRMRCSK